MSAYTSYKSLKRQNFTTASGFSLVPIRVEDVEPIRCWRNEQQAVLRQKHPISAEEQRNYFHRSVWPTFDQEHPSQLLFSFLLAGKSIGYGALTNINWVDRRSELSFLLDTARVEDPKGYREAFLAFLTMLAEVAFDELRLHRLFAETFSFRTAHLAILEEFGYKYEGTLREHIFLEGKYYDSFIHGLLERDRDKMSSAKFVLPLQGNFT